MSERLFQRLDTAKTQYYHFKAVTVTGMGLFTDAYHIFSITPILRLLGHVYYESNDNQIPPSVECSMLAIALLGTVIGELVFGRLGDIVGRRRLYGLALMFMMAGSFGSGFSMGTSRGCVLASLGFFRFFLGVGIGGDYPLSATIMSEYANKTMRGAFMAAVFSMQGFGILASSVVTMAVCKIFSRIYPSPPSDPTPKEADMAWRLILMLGVVPAAATFYWRMKIPETARYTALVEKNVPQATSDMERVLEMSHRQIAEGHPLQPSLSSYPLFSKQFFLRHGRNLLACSAAWFLLDIVFYSSSLFQSKIYHKYLRDEHTGKAVTAFEVASLQAIVACYSTIPGYIAVLFLIDRVGRLSIQAIGFVLMAIVYFAIGVPYDRYWRSHTNKLFMFLYGLTFFFANCGPNTTTFILPAELFPARFRTTCHGIAGAAGKVGAIIGVVGFLMASQDDDQNGHKKALGGRFTLVTLSGICVVGMAVTNLFTKETKGTSLEENE
ncbi:probable inorganic phosphate transporter 1-8 [Rhodamnia argentea]|uniref:Probable inorganic phosphate transporter 1-8 n=1 Tax=Rhodamnia argentea TaxID=178133 RepID=A0ABM3H2Z4_9MYRT|nr:probable inorganic phosphate transporter 1-8 [Rhodamnia argentea]